MKAYIFITIFLLLLTGCSTTVTPSVTEYKIALESIESTSNSKGCKEKSLKIAQAFSSNTLMSLQMSYVQGKEKVYAYTQAQWKNSPNQIITTETLKSIRDSKLFKTTQNPKSRASSDLILEINIEDFMQYYTQDLKDSSSHVELSFALVDTKTNDIVTSNTFEAEKMVDSLDALGGVKGLNLALEDVLVQLISYMNKECK